MSKKANIEVGEGYRRLKQGEVINEGDEFLIRKHGEWHYTVEPGHKVGMTLASIYRRRMPDKIMESAARIKKYAEWHETGTRTTSPVPMRQLIADMLAAAKWIEEKSK